MYCATTHRTRVVMGAALICMITVAAPNAAAQDNYLDMLDAYSDDVQQGASSADDKTGVNSRFTFEGQLRRNFKGSYVLYTKLTDVSKDIVFNKYQETGSVADVRSLIVKLYAQR